MKSPVSVSQVPVPVPPDFSWRLPEADDRKVEMIGKPWGEPPSDYVWYDLGEINSLTEDEVAAIKGLFFVGYVNSGNVELEASKAFPGAILRLRGADHFLPSFELRGRRCALYQVGCSVEFRYALDEGFINFHYCWNDGADKATAAIPNPS